jgi:MinD-like ATPase involved in chromosome partitioning or flagellar assembly
MDTNPSTSPAVPARFEARPPAAAVWQAPAAAEQPEQALQPDLTDKFRVPPGPATAATTPAGPPAPPADTEPARPGSPVARAQWGWRGRVNRLSGLTLAPAEAELVHRAARKRLLRPFRRTMTVMVANPKGGAAKTPTTLLTAATLGYYRGGYTVAWDNNETRGTLGMRAEAADHRRTVVDLLDQVDDFVSGDAGAGALSGFLRPQSARFDVLASDNTPGGMDVIDDDAFRRLWSALSRYYRLLVIDTGNNVRAPNWRAASALADCLVVPTTVDPDVAGSGLWMLDHLISSGQANLAANAVVVVSCADPRTDPARIDEVVAAYRDKAREVVVIPHDPYVRAGGPIEYDSLAVETRRAWLLACTSIIDSLATREPAG